jgi:L-aminopeptidase/D-esterase-like protein
MPLRMNTTISCVVTNANLTKAQATKVAQMAADGYARSIDPVHTTNDGDTVFVLATGEVNAQVDVVGQAAAEAVAKAIANGCKHAATAYGVPGAASKAE